MKPAQTESPNGLADIISTYKLHETSAFVDLFGHGYRKLTIQKLLSASFAKIRSSTKRNTILTHLRKALKGRITARSFFNTPSGSHDYFIDALHELLGNLKAEAAVSTDRTCDEAFVAQVELEPTATDDDDVSSAEEETEAVGRTAEETGANLFLAQAEYGSHTIDTLDFLSFLDLLLGMATMICERWRGVKAGDLAAACWVSGYIFLEIKAAIHQTELIREEWFKEGKLIKIAQHKFFDDLERIDEDQKLTHLTKLMDVVMEAPPDYCPSFILNMCENIQKRREPLFDNIIWHILAATQDFATTDHRNAAVNMFDYAYKRHSELCDIRDEEPEAHPSAGLRHALAICPDIIYIGYNFAHLTAKLFDLFQYFLAFPLLPALVHLYLKGRDHHSQEKIELLERCLSDTILQAAFFWNGQPKTKEELRTGMVCWTAGFNSRAENMFDRRSEGLVLKHLSGNIDALSGSAIELLRKDQGKPILDALTSRVETEMMIPDITVMWQSAWNTIKALKKNHKMEATDAALFLMEKFEKPGFDEESEVFFKLFASNWKVSSQKSPWDKINENKGKLSCSNPL